MVNVLIHILYISCTPFVRACKPLDSRVKAVQVFTINAIMSTKLIVN